MGLARPKIISTEPQNPRHKGSVASRSIYDQGRGCAKGNSADRESPWAAFWFLAFNHGRQVFKLGCLARINDARVRKLFLESFGQLHQRPLCNTRKHRVTSLAQKLRHFLQIDMGPVGLEFFQRPLCQPFAGTRT